MTNDSTTIDVHVRYMYKYLSYFNFFLSTHEQSFSEPTSQLLHISIVKHGDGGIVLRGCWLRLRVRQMKLYTEKPSKENLF